MHARARPTRDRERQGRQMRCIREIIPYIGTPHVLCSTLKHNRRPKNTRQIIANRSEATHRAPPEVGRGSGRLARPGSKRQGGEGGDEAGMFDEERLFCGHRGLGGYPAKNIARRPPPTRGCPPCPEVHPHLAAPCSPRRPRRSLSAAPMQLPRRRGRPFVAARGGQSALQ